MQISYHKKPTWYEILHKPTLTSMVLELGENVDIQKAGKIDKP